MIVKERKDDFVMIEQHEHAKLSGHLFCHLKKEYKPSKTFVSAVQYAIYNHDYGWIPFDKAPFWNDEQNSPYSFINFPTAPKAILYEYGINKVMEKDLYAALLCSEHYGRFLHQNTAPEAIDFIEKEKLRQKRIKEELQTPFDETLFLSHYEYVQFFDNLSLYVCLNEPGIHKEKEHPYFKQGIKLPSLISGNLLLQWSSTKDILMNKDIFESSVTLKLIQRVVLKKDIATYGIQKAFQHAQCEEVEVSFKKGNTF